MAKNAEAPAGQAGASGRSRTAGDYILARALGKATGSALPHSEESERAVLGGILLEPELLATVDLTAEDFYLERHQTLWRCFSDLAAAGSPIDRVTVQAWLELRDAFDAIGGLSYLAQLDLDLPDIGRLDAYSYNVRERAVRRRLIELAIKTADRAINPQATGAEVFAETQLELATAGGRIGAALGGRRYRLLSDLIQNPELLDPPEPVVPHLAWRGRVTLLSAQPKAGKSTLLGWITACVTRGERCFGGDGESEEGTVLWVSAEEHEGDICRRLAGKFGAVPERVAVLTAPFTIAEIRAAVLELKPRLVIIDTLFTLAALQGKVPETAAEWTPLLLQLVQIARETNAAVVVAHHSKKENPKEYRDSSAIAGAADCLASLTKDRGDRNAREYEYAGRCGAGEVRLVYTGGGFQTGDSATRNPEAEILQALLDNPGTTKEGLAKLLSIRRQTVFEICSRLAKEGRIENRGTERRPAWHLVQKPPIPEPPPERFRERLDRSASNPTGSKGNASGNGSGNGSSARSVPPSLKRKGGNASGRSTPEPLDEVKL